jgi:predicted ferric reductase
MIASVGGLSSQDLWYLSRGSGLVLLVVFNLVIVLGGAVRASWSPKGTARFVIEGLHRNLSLLACVLLVIHVISAIADPYVSIGWLALIVPFTSPYRTLWIGLGTLSADLLIAIVLTSLLRAHLGRRAWRVVHLCVYLAWPLALFHGLEAGNDLAIGWVRGTVWGTTLAAVAAIAITFAGRTPMRARRPAPTVTVRPSRSPESAGLRR